MYNSVVHKLTILADIICHYLWLKPLLGIILTVASKTFNISLPGNIDESLRDRTIVITGFTSYYGEKLLHYLMNKYSTNSFVLLNDQGSIPDKFKSLYGSNRVEILEVLDESPDSVLAAYLAKNPSCKPGLLLFASDYNSEDFYMAKDAENSSATFRRTVDVNFLNAIMISKLILTRMVEKKIAGTVIYLSNIASKINSPLRPEYCAVKNGVSVLAECLDTEYKDCGIRVCCLQTLIKGQEDCSAPKSQDTSHEVKSIYRIISNFNSYLSPVVHNTTLRMDILCFLRKYVPNYWYMKSQQELCKIN